MEEEKQLSEEESLQLIAKMIQKAKGNFHERGTSAILWGSTVAIAGIISFLEGLVHFYIGFDIWLLTVVALVLQVFISIRESRQRKAISHDEAFMNAIWIVYGISLFALVFYTNIMPYATAKILASQGVEWLIKDNHTGTVKHLVPYVPGQTSLYLILYSIPTLATGIAHKFKPMLIGGILCYVFFVISCFTPFTWDMLLMALAGVFNWLIPGIILRKRYLKGKSYHV